MGLKVYHDGSNQLILRFGRISPTLGFTTPPAWMDAIGVHVPNQSATQFAILAANICHGTSNQALWSTCPPLPPPPLPRIWRKWLLQLVTKFWTMFSSYLEDNNSSHSFQIHKSLKDKKVVLLAVPRAFTATCRCIAQEFNCWMLSTFFAKTSTSVNFLRLSKAGWFVRFWNISYNCFVASSTCWASSTML